MAFYLAKYNTGTTIQFPMIKRAVVDFAATGDWTPATGDTKLSKDQGSYANSTNNPAAVAGAGSIGWSLALTATELQCAELAVQIVDSATKAVEDQFVVVYTYGNASAKFPFDFSDQVRGGLTALPNANAEAAGGLYTRGSGAGQITQPANGVINGNLVTWLGTAPNALISGRVETVIGAVTAGAIAAAGFASGALDAVWSTTTRLLSAGTNIVLAKGTGVTGFNDPSAATTAAAVWNEALSGHTTAGSAGKVLSDGVADIVALNDISIADILGAVYEGAETLQDYLRLTRAVAVGQSSGHPTSPVFKAADTTTPRVSATLDSNGNRTAITLDAS